MPADDSTSSNRVQGLTPQTLNIIRFALLGGVLFFAAIGWFVGGSGQMSTTGNEDLASLMRYLFYGFFVMTFGAMYLIRQRVDRAETFAKKGPLILVGYAAGEGLALYGVIYWMLTGSFMLFLVGLLVFLVTFLVFPVQPVSDEA